LGTTSKRVLDALTELDGRPRSPQSTVEEDEAERVREALATSPAEEEGADELSGADVDGDEPESRLILETAPEPERADYLPLFVAPQPVQVEFDADADADDEDEDDEDGGPDSDDDQGERPAARRRRRGRRGRGRGRGEQGGDDSDDDSGDTQTAAKGGDEDSDDSDDESGDEDGGAEGATRRRRRRRRRKSGSGDDNENGASPDDPPNTVVHERAPRTAKDKDKDNGEIQGISGSTRLEAKRQRRRDGRDAGRRRPPILSEA
jgi:ribonuclease E